MDFPWQPPTDWSKHRTLPASRVERDVRWRDFVDHNAPINKPHLSERVRVRALRQFHFRPDGESINRMITPGELITIPRPDADSLAAIGRVELLGARS